jgi:FkbM family methyltransferase
MNYFHNQSVYDQFPKTEIDFFNLIKKYVDVVFDIGSRDDIDYIKNSYDKSRQFHLFEPVPEFILNCQEQIENLSPSDDVDNEIHLNAIGIGSESGFMDYYPNTQSFVFRTHDANSLDVGLSFPIKTLDEYCDDKKISNIDFLKIDIEGMEIDVLNGGKKIIENNTKIVQFEFGLCILDRKIEPDDLVGWFNKEIFDIYLQRVDPRHRYYNQNNKILTPLTEEVYGIIKSHMFLGDGCNLIAIRKELSDKIYTESLEFNK